MATAARVGEGRLIERRGLTTPGFGGNARSKDTAAELMIRRGEDFLGILGSVGMKAVPVEQAETALRAEKPTRIRDDAGGPQPATGRWADLTPVNPQRRSAGLSGTAAGAGFVAKLGLFGEIRLRSGGVQRTSR